MKHISYMISWLCPVYIVSFVWDVATTALLTWFYGMRFDELTPRLYLWGWLACMALIGVAIYILEDGVAKSHYVGGKTYPLAATVISQVVAVIIYIVVGFISNFKGLFYFPSVYLAFVINEFDTNIITNGNEETWNIVLMVLHALFFAAVGMIAYIREKNRLVENKKL